MPKAGGKAVYSRRQSFIGGNMTNGLLRCAAGKNLIRYMAGMAALLLVAIGAAAAGDDPLPLVAAMVGSTVNALKAGREELRGAKGTATGIAIATRVIAPEVDFERLTREAVGAAWNDASEAQKAGLQQRFRRLILHVAGAMLASYDDELLTMAPFTPVANADEVEIRINVAVTHNAGDEPPAPIFVKLHRTAAGWRIFDFRSEGVSLARLYAGNFKGVIARRGIDGLIELLDERNRRNAAAAGIAF